MFVSHAKYDQVRQGANARVHGPPRAVKLSASAVGPERIAFTGTSVVNRTETGVPVAKRLEYRVDQADATFRVTFDHRRDAFMLDFGAAGAYLRFIGDVTVEHLDGGQVSTESGETLWELLYFGDRAGFGPNAIQSATLRPAVVGHRREMHG
jgi:hypothetical protein